MTNNISTLIDSQVPDAVLDSSPLFGEFVKTYYKYVEQRTKSSGAIQYQATDADIDTTLDKYVDSFYALYGEFLPKEIAFDKRNFIKLLNNIYEAKGTEKALKLLFRAIFNEEIEVSYPNFLRASDGRWEQDNFITLKTIYGTAAVVGDFLTIGDVSQTTVEIIAANYVSPGNNRYYFKTLNNLHLVDDQLIKVISADTGKITYIGKLVKSPSRLLIKIPGTSWQRGQVIVIPGTYKNTIAKVTNIDSVGGIAAIEIVDHGFDHVENQTAVISPYPSKPIGSSVNITTVAVNTPYAHYEHSIEISDFTEGVEEHVLGVASNTVSNSYFLQDYVDVDYFGAKVIETSSKQGITLTNDVAYDPSLTMEMWIASRAYFNYEYANLVRTKGRYIDDSGQISNNAIKLHDSYFYQAFSYVIDSTKDVNEYKGLLNITHPAGMKYFASLNKNVDYYFDFGSTRYISIDTLYMREVVLANDNLAKNVTKPFVDFVTESEFRTLGINKTIIGDNLTVSQTSFTKILGKVLNETVTTSESLVKSSTKLLTDSVNNSESLTIDANKILTDIMANSTDTIAKSSIKYINSDAVEASHPELYNTALVGYAIDYIDAAEQYSLVEKLLTIGY